MLKRTEPERTLKLSTRAFARAGPLTIPQKQVAPADKQNLRVLQDQKHFSCSGSVRTFLLQPRYTVLLLRDALLPRADQVFNFAQLVGMNGHWACNQNYAP